LIRLRSREVCTTHGGHVSEKEGKCGRKLLLISRPASTSKAADAGWCWPLSSTAVQSGLGRLSHVTGGALLMGAGRLRRGLGRRWCEAWAGASRRSGHDGRIKSQANRTNRPFPRAPRTCSRPRVGTRPPCSVRQLPDHPRNPWVWPFWAPCVASLLESYIKERYEPCEAYFPIQNRLKMTPSRSSELNSPVIEFN